MQLELTNEQAAWLRTHMGSLLEKAYWGDYKLRFDRKHIEDIKRQIDEHKRQTER